MSQSEIERFVGDLKTNHEMLGEVKSGASGLDSVVEMANAKGYDITVDEAKAYINSEATKDLSDEQLDAISGGQGSLTTTQAVTIQTVTQTNNETITLAAAAKTAVGGAAEVNVASVVVVT